MLSCPAQVSTVWAAAVELEHLRIESRTLQPGVGDFKERTVFSRGNLRLTVKNGGRISQMTGHPDRHYGHRQKALTGCLWPYFLGRSPCKLELATELPLPR